jgi:hypothetical protein
MKCRDKTPFASEATARAVAKEWDQAVYRCPHCCSFHCTTKAQDDSPEEIAREARSRALVEERAGARQKTAEMLRDLAHTAKHTARRKKIGFRGRKR